jgi:hypothetical protein
VSTPSPVAYQVAGERELEGQPPQELTWDSTLRDLFAASYKFSDDLLQAAPRFIRMYGDRWQINWQLADGVEEPQNQSVVDIFITVRPVAPATIDIYTP